MKIKNHLLRAACGMALLIGTDAAAQTCSPSNPTNGATVTCAGTFNFGAGVTSAANDLTVVIAPGAVFGDTDITMTGDRPTVVNQGRISGFSADLNLGSSFFVFDPSLGVTIERSNTVDGVFVNDGVVGDNSFSSGPSVTFAADGSTFTNNGTVLSSRVEFRGAGARSFVNNGRIGADDASAAVLFTANNPNATSQFINNGIVTRASISGNSFFFNGEQLGGLEIVNNGVFEEAAEISGGSGADTFVNSGEVQSRVRLQQGDDTFTNKSGGVVSGQVSLGRGEDLATLEAGGVFTETGELFLGSGDDTLIVEAGAVFEGVASGGGSRQDNDFGFEDTAIIRSANIDLSRLINFEIFEIDAGDAVSVRGGETFAAQSVTLRSGSLDINGLFQASSLTLADGAGLSGLGAISGLNNGPLDIIVNGVVSPGISRLVGGAPPLGVVDTSLDITGDVTFASGSTLRIETVTGADLGADVGFESAIFADSIAVDGAVTLEGGALEIVQAGDNRFVGETSLTVISATDGVSGNFGAVAAPMNAVLQGVRFVGGSVIVDLRSQIGGANASALSTTAGVYAAYLDEVSLTTEDAGTISFVQDLLAIEDVELLDAALTGLSAAPYASMDLINIETGFALRGAVEQAIAAQRPKGGQFYAWATGFAVAANQNAGRGPSDTDIDVQGGLIGGGYALSDSAAIGAFIGVTNLSQEFSALPATVDGDGFVFGGYASLNRDNLSASLLLARSTADAQTSKAIPVLMETASGETDVNAVIGAVSFAYDFFRGDNIAFGPLANVTYISSTRGEFTEFGAGGANLITDDQDTAYLFGEIGAHIHTRDALAFGLRPYARGGLRYEALGNDSITAAGLAAEEDRALTPGVNAARANGFVAVGASAEVATGVLISLGYDGAFGDGLTRNRGTANLTIVF